MANTNEQERIGRARTTLATDHGAADLVLQVDLLGDEADEDELPEFVDGGPVLALVVVVVVVVRAGARGNTTASRLRWPCRGCVRPTVARSQRGVRVIIPLGVDRPSTRKQTILLLPALHQTRVCRG